MQEPNDSQDGYSIGGVTTAGMYAPANFPDADGLEHQPPSMISNTVSHSILFHTLDPNDRQQQTKMWRRKTRELLNSHQEKILQFFVKPLDANHPMRSARTLLQKYGKQPPGETTRISNMTLKDILVDISGSAGPILADVNAYVANLERLRQHETPVQRWHGVSKQLLDYMRDCGDELLRLDMKLTNECMHLDSVIEKITQLITLPRPELAGFDEMLDAYVKSQFEEHKIEALYWDYLNTLQKYSILRDMLLPQRMSMTTAADPVCCICMTENVTMAFVPCGHTFCQNCAKRTIMCHVCRQVITNRVRLFFG